MFKSNTVNSWQCERCNQITQVGLVHVCPKWDGGQVTQSDTHVIWIGPEQQDAQMMIAIHTRTVIRAHTLAGSAAEQKGNEP
jgi:hypothetical protein